MTLVRTEYEAYASNALRSTVKAEPIVALSRHVQRDLHTIFADEEFSSDLCVV